MNHAIEQRSNSATVVWTPWGSQSARRLSDIALKIEAQRRLRRIREQRTRQTDRSGRPDITLV
ncbi:MAG: hypothetical protein Q8Q62_07570 [Mesorhizobium sp.]|nr:hypothetical protein [Mesorhizobium sp.]